MGLSPTFGDPHPTLPVWYKQWCRPKVVGGRTAPQGGLQGNSQKIFQRQTWGRRLKVCLRKIMGEPSHNAWRLVRVSADPPMETVLPPTTCGLHHCFFIGSVLRSAYGRGLVISASWSLVIFDENWFLSAHDWCLVLSCWRRFGNFCQELVLIFN